MRNLTCLQTLLFFTGAVGPLPAQEATKQPDRLPAADIVSSLVVPQGGRNIIIQRVRPPDVPAAPRVVAPPLTPEEIAAVRARFEPLRLLFITATIHPGGRAYLEWRSPEGGGKRFGAWSNADCRLFSAIGEFRIENDRTRYLTIISVRPARPTGPDSIRPTIPPVPADGPGFVIVKGDSADSRAVNPVAAVHHIYKTEAPQLRLRLEERQQQRVADEVLQAAHPVTPQDAIIRFWPKKSRHNASAASAPSTHE